MSAVHITDDVCVQSLEHSRYADQSDAEKQEKIAEALGSGLQHLKLEMVNGSQGSMTEKLLKISDHPHFVSYAQRHSLSSAIDVELSAEMNMQLDLIQAAGSMTKDLKETINEISAKAKTLIPSQKLKFVEVVFNTYQLQQANTGRIAMATADIEKLANNTLAVMRELAMDVVLPPSLKTISLDIIKTTAKIFQLPELDREIIQFDRETSPSQILEQTVDTLKATLMALLDQDDLGVDARQNIEEALKKLNDLEGGEQVPRDILKSLDEIATEITDNQKNPVIIAMAETLTQNIETVREVNIHVKAEKFNLTIEQVRAIEATMDVLDGLGEELPKDEITVKGRAMAVFENHTMPVPSSNLPVFTPIVSMPYVTPLSPAPIANPAFIPDPQPELEPDIQPDPQPELEPDIQPDPQPELEPDIQPELEPQLGPQLGSQPEFIVAPERKKIFDDLFGGDDPNKPNKPDAPCLVCPLKGKCKKDQNKAADPNKPKEGPLTEEEPEREPKKGNSMAFKHG